MNLSTATAAATHAASTTPSKPGAAAASGHRLASIDVVRGVVMILMAIDHVRVFSGVPAGGPTAGVFFTRWVTHFVAPAFIFLAGTAAFLHGRRMQRVALARFLVARGSWLILLELTFLRVAWTFNFDFGSYLLAGVIWVIGWCMILLAPLVFLPTAAIGALGVGVIACHNLLDFLPGSAVQALQQSPLARLAQLLYFGGGIRLGGGPLLVVLYTVVPWIGVIAAGYAFGAVMTFAPERRRRIALRLGLAATALFLLLRAADVYGDPRGWRLPPTPPAGSPQATQTTAGTQAPAPQVGPQRPVQQAPPAWLRFINTSKYPASLLFLLMTLGPMLIALGLLEGARGRVADVLATFGRVPLFYYLLHIPLIHFAAVVVSLLRTGAVEPWLFANHPMLMGPPPAGYTWSLGLLYLVTAAVVTLLYVPCRWFARVKAERRDLRWLSYL